MIDKIDNKTTLRAIIDIDEPEVLITDAGTPQIKGRAIHIDAIAHQVTFISPPSKETQEFRYELEDLDPGEYTVTYAINERVEAKLNFKIHGDGKPLPDLLSVRTGEAEDDEWYGKVAVALRPGQQIIDWGSPRQNDRELHINLIIDELEEDGPVLVDPVPTNEIPDEVQKDSEGNYLIDGCPVRLVSHLYYFGKLSEGTYTLHVHSRGNLLTSLPFDVQGIPPQMELITNSISETKANHRFKINYKSLTGLNIDSIRSAKVWVMGPDDYREEATHETFTNPDDHPVTFADGTYSVSGPKGLWNHRTNGSYQIVIEAEKILDTQGNVASKSYLGDFQVEILSQVQSGTD